MVTDPGFALYIITAVIQMKALKAIQGRTIVSGMMEFSMDYSHRFVSSSYKKTMKLNPVKAYEISGGSKLMLPIYVICGLRLLWYQRNCSLSHIMSTICELQYSLQK